MDSTSYSGHDGDEGIDFPFHCIGGLDEWVVFFSFLLNCNGGESVVAVCEFNEVTYVWWGGVEWRLVVGAPSMHSMFGVRYHAGASTVK